MDMRSARPAPKVAEEFYLSSAWLGLRATLIKQRGRRCETCGKTHDGGQPVRLIGDHIIERKDGGADLDPRNVRLVCIPCHNVKTARERAARLKR
jgi:5-methylcytosine-specific restriction endonuclease McrA